jgi:hypothetical protein
VDAAPWSESHKMFTQLIVSDGKTKFAIRVGLGKQDWEMFFILDEKEVEISLQKLDDRINRYHSRS